MVEAPTRWYWLPVVVVVRGARHKYVCIIRCDLPHYPTRSDSCFITMSTLPCLVLLLSASRPIQVDGSKPFRSSVRDLRAASRKSRSFHYRVQLYRNPAVERYIAISYGHMVLASSCDRRRTNLDRFTSRMEGSLSITTPRYSRLIILCRCSRHDTSRRVDRRVIVVHEYM